ncbi:MAG TPA: ATPase, partial [Myxococcales bacterium]|nr:ATPase [Myxococcales bacterium]
MHQDIRALNELVQRESAFVDNLLAETQKVVVGQKYMLERALIGLICGGHVLLEGVPGLAKTLTVKTLADTLTANFMRLQFTPDLLP